MGPMDPVNFKALATTFMVVEAGRDHPDREIFDW